MQRTSEKVIDRRNDWRALPETRRTRVDKAQDCDRGAKQNGSDANGREGDIRDDDESGRNARDLTPANSPPSKYECRPPWITNVAAVPSPIIEDKYMGCEGDAAEK
jgi:hypothetical protein